ncbi:NAD(P)-dependent oxidoreductase [Arthrobacter sp. Soil782]|uniref:SDR family oxidoreductase n=1 Tax=Arthrobacter sp. Soil782 TaxID=1736410 RepID=UPI0006F7EB2B|nr:SDR family oxidoreductase [Arthrobacter sp. Soil782]KRF08770.1 NAD(P)-dependent oxidoreductase [Arthrobacter sp. Soil782]
MTPRLAVTGSTGHVGGEVARLLSNAGYEQKLIVRDPTRAPDLPGAKIAQASYAEREAAVEALRGSEVLFMVSGAEAQDRVDQHRTFIDAAAEAGIQHIIYTSFLAAAPDATFTLGRDHWATEEHIRNSGMAYTFLRDNFYLDVLPLFAGNEGVLRGPAGDGRVAAVARTDVARAAVVVLENPVAHVGRTWDLTGPEALSLSEVAAIITRVTGRPTRYEEETVEEAYASRAPYGVPDWQLDAWVSTYTAIASGQLERTTTAVQELTGSAPLDLEKLLTR